MIWSAVAHIFAGLLELNQVNKLENHIAGAKSSLTQLNYGISAITGEKKKTPGIQRSFVYL